jgi:hypothetical protein
MKLGYSEHMESRFTSATSREGAAAAAYSEMVRLAAEWQPLVRIPPDTPPFVLKPEFQSLNLDGLRLRGPGSFRPTWAMHYAA